MKTQRVVKTVSGDFTKVEYLQFKKEYEEADKNGDMHFVFRGNLFSTKFAKYLTEYLKERFGE